MSHPLRGQPDGRDPEGQLGWVKAMLHSIYDQPDAASVHAQFDRVVKALTDKLVAVAEHLEEACADILAFTAFPKEVWRQIWSNNPAERLSAIRLIGAVLAEQHDDWAEGRRYLGLDVLNRSRLALIDNPHGQIEEDLTPAALTA